MKIVELTVNVLLEVPDDENLETLTLGKYFYISANHDTEARGPYVVHFETTGVDLIPED